jgi:hypothetical protein
MDKPRTSPDLTSCHAVSMRSLRAPGSAILANFALIEMPSLVGSNHLPHRLIVLVLMQQRHRQRELGAKRFDNIADTSTAGVVARPSISRRSLSTDLTSSTLYARVTLAATDRSRHWFRQDATACSCSMPSSRRVGTQAAIHSSSLS